MKKYVVGLFAIAIAIVLNSFTMPVKKEVKYLTPYYWYQVNGSGQAIGSPLNPTTKEDRSVAVGYETGCNLTSGDECLAGFETLQSTPVAIPTNNTENMIFKN